MKTIDFRVDVLRGGVPFTQLIFNSAPTIFCDSEAQIKMSMRGTFLFHPDVDYINDELRPVVTINGRDHNFGVYKIVTRSSRFNDAGIQYDTIEAYDRTVALTWTKFETRPYYAQGNSYDLVLSNYLTAAGIKNIVFVPSGQRFRVDRSDWEIGDSYLTAANDLLAEINYNQLSCDVDGNVVLRPYEAPSADVIDHQYNEKSAILAPSITTETDLYNKPNVFIAIVENPEYSWSTNSQWYAKAVNDSPASKFSTINRGIRIPEVVRLKNIASQSALTKYAEKLRNDSMQTNELVDLTTAIMPGHNVGDVVALVHPAINGIFKEISWQVTMQPGASMTHKLRRVVVV